MLAVNTLINRALLLVGVNTAACLLVGEAKDFAHRHLESDTVKLAADWRPLGVTEWDQPGFALTIRPSSLPLPRAAHSRSGRQVAPAAGLTGNRGD